MAVVWWVLGTLTLMVLIFLAIKWQQDYLDRKQARSYGSWATDVLDAASRGVDVSFLDDCPDLHRLAAMREKKH